MTTDNFCFYLQNSLTQNSQTGGQWYSGTSPFSIPWSIRLFVQLFCCMSGRPPAHLSISVCLSPSVYPSVAVSLTVRLSVCLCIALWKGALYRILKIAYFFLTNSIHFEEVQSFAPLHTGTIKNCNRAACIRHQCMKATVLSCHRFLINTCVVKIDI
jgi:hypothetical protein